MASSQPLTRALRRLRKAGVERIVMLTGDRRDVAETQPQDKLAAIKASRSSGSTIMVGDGVNDAPALAAADVGVAMGERGTAASSEVAGIVLLIDRLDRLAEALRIFDVAVILNALRALHVHGPRGGGSALPPTELHALKTEDDELRGAASQDDVAATEISTATNHHPYNAKLRLCRMAARVELSPNFGDGLRIRRRLGLEARQNCR
jgi:hypothetical protein